MKGGDGGWVRRRAEGLFPLPYHDISRTFLHDVAGLSTDKQRQSRDESEAGRLVVVGTSLDVRGNLDLSGLFSSLSSRSE